MPVLPLHDHDDGEKEPPTGADQLGNRQSLRVKKISQRGLEFKTDTLKQHFRYGVSLWRRHANNLDRLIADDIDDVADLKEERDKLDSAMNRLEDLYNELFEYHIITPEQSKTFDVIEAENRQLMKDVRREIEAYGSSQRSSSASDRNSYHSASDRRTHRSVSDRRSNHSDSDKRSHHSDSDKRSHHSDLDRRSLHSNSDRHSQHSSVHNELIKAVTDAAELQVELEHLDGIANKQTALHKANLKKKYEKARARVDATQEIIGIEKRKTSSDVSERSLNPIAEEFVPAALNAKPLPVNGTQEMTNTGGPDLVTVATENHSMNDSQISHGNEVQKDDFAQEPIKTFLQDVVRQQNETLSCMTLPSLEIPVFDGDAMNYTNFVHAFDNVIERRTADPSQRLYYLIQYTAGEVKCLVKSCQSLEPVTGYQTARDLLKTTYGQAHKIATACIEKATKGHEIKAEDSKLFHEFAITLKSCQIILKQIGYLEKIEVADNLKKITARLPYDSRKRWRSRADNITEEKHRDVTFDDVVKFVTVEARTLRHSVFGDIQGNKANHDTQKKLQTQKHRAVASITQAVGSEKQGPSPGKSNTTMCTTNQVTDVVKPEPQKMQTCFKCKGDHKLEACKEFCADSYDGRREFTMKQGLCFNCLYPKHRVRECRRRPSCSKCQKKHCTLLHPPTVETTQVSAFVDANNNKIALPILPVKVRVPGQEAVVTYAFLDGGSTTSFCTESLLSVLGAEGQKTKICLTTLEKANSQKETEIVHLQILDLEEEVMFDLPAVFSRPSLPVCSDDIPNQQSLSKWPYLKDVQIPDVRAEVGILVGNDNSVILEPMEIIKSRHGGPYASRTALGWLVNGPLGQDTCRRHKCSFIKSDARLETMFKRYCDLEFMDRNVDKPEMSQEDKRAMQNMEQSITREDSHYQLGLPWRELHPHLEDNKSMVEHRLHLLKKRLRNNPDLKQRYTKFIDDLFVADHAQLVPNSELNRSDGLVWYLPHHPVINPKKPKLRVVFDCSARYHNQSLNDHLLQGPVMTNNLVGVLIRFRLGNIAMVADIEKMFHQVRVKPDHRDALRFLWWPHGNLEADPVAHRMNVHPFGATSSPSCANFALLRTASDHKDKFSPCTIEAVRQNFYVDDFLKSVDTITEAQTLAKELCSLLSLGGFRLTKWTSPSTELMSSIPESERTVSKQLDLQESTSEKVLGLEWDVQNDTFFFKLNVKFNAPTRRGLLSTLSSIYDPLGMISPTVLHGKMILQQMSSRGLAWDEDIPEDLEKQTINWISSLKGLEDFKVNRCLKPPSFNNPVKYELHHFSDASESGYGAVSYLRVVNDDEQIHTALLMSKARVAPLKRVSIPRLELSAATVSTRLDKLLRRELPLPLAPSVYWTDSTTVLRYIENSKKRFNTFVANRVATIQDHSETSQWHYVDTRSNPADQASRGQVPEKQGNSLWLTGPDFLQRTPEHWPERPPALLDRDDDNDLEIKKPKKVAATVTTSGQSPTDQLLSYFSSWTKLKRIVAWFLRLRQKFLNHRKNEPPTARKSEPDPLTLEEVKHAETAVLRYVQSTHFHQEIEDMEKGRPVRKSSSLYKLDPILPEHLLRIGGRLKNSTIPDDAKHQIILPKDSHVTTLIVRHWHELSAHSGRNYVLSLLRRRFWIIKGNATVRRVIGNCVQCKRNFGRAGTQQMANLPDDRVSSEHPPFTKVGIDYFGPFEIKRGRSIVKRYGCIFTCLSVRAVHIEIAHTLDTDSFIHALRRFISRRGPPDEIRSDNGTNFIGGEREMRQSIKEWNQHKVEDFLQQQSIEWKFNAPLASHQGGVWERCIRTIRKVLRSLLGNQKLDEEGLCTLMCEIEAIINGRPLTPIPEDPRDLSALTPNHLLLLRYGSTFPPGLFRKEDMYVRRRWKQVQFLAEQFWIRWVREYLPILQIRTKWQQKERNFKKGDLVLVADESTPRNQWPLGLVIDVYPAADGSVRQVLVRMRGKQFRRDIRKLHFLECSSPD